MCEDQRIKHGYLYRVTKTIMAEPSSTSKIKRRQVVEVVEIIEFRYFSPAHFRTTDDLYLKLSQEDFVEHTEPFGKIFENIRSRNKNSLKEILSAKLYDEVKSIK